MEISMWTNSLNIDNKIKLSKYLTSLILTIIFSFLSTASYGISLTDTCQQATIDINRLNQDSSEYIKTAENVSYKTRLASIQELWTNKISEDECAIGGCEMDSDDLKTSIVITLMNGLIAKLVTLSDRQSIQELQLLVETNNENKSIFTQTLIKINNLCPELSDEKVGLIKN